MIKLHKNMSLLQPVTFRSIENMKKLILNDPYAYDGLALFDEDGEVIVNLRYIEGYNHWEVEEVPDYASSPMTLKEAVDAFADAIVTGYRSE